VSAPATLAGLGAGGALGRRVGDRDGHRDGHRHTERDGARACCAFAGSELRPAVVNTGMALPHVVVGLVVALVLFRSGPLGSLNLIYTVRGMIIAQVLIAAPLITGITMAAIQALPAELPTSCGRWAPTAASSSCACGSRRACRCWPPSWPASVTRLGGRRR
jgi:hypothetical protein